MERDTNERPPASASAQESADKLACVADELAGVCDPLSALEAVLQQSDHAIVALDLDGVALMWNPAAEALTGWSATEAIGTGVDQLFAGSRDATLRQIRAVAAQGAVGFRDVRLARRGGDVISVRFALAPLLDRQGHACGVLAVAFGIAQDARFDGLRRGFIDLVATELRGPLTAVLGYAQLLTTSDVLEDISERNALARALDERCTELSGLVDDLFLLSGLLEAEEHHAAERFDPCEAASAVARRMSASGRTVGVSTHDTCADVRVTADRLRLERVVEGLMSAAIDEGPVPAATLTLSASDEYAVIEIASASAEPGLVSAPAGTRAARSAPVTPGRPEAFRTGLRLRFAERFAELSGGDVAGSHDPDWGSRFVLRLPLRLPEEA